MKQSIDKPSVLSVGRLYCDLIFTGLPRMPTLGTEVFSDDFGAHAGGGAFITAAHMAQIGHPSYLGAMLPVSPYRDLIQPDLEASNVDLSLCNTLTQQDGPQITVAMVQDADRSFLTRRAGPAFPPITAQDIANRTIRHVHIGEVASLIEAPDILKAALAQSVTVSADCGWDDDFDFAALQPFIGMIDVFLPNESEMQTLQGCGFATSLAKVTVIKRGGQGATLVTADGSVSVPAIPTQVVDTTGAGDAFNAGFLARWLDGASAEACLTAGNARGAMAVRTRGGFSPE